MSFHPNEIQRRGRFARAIVGITVALLVGAFFRTQVLQNATYALKSEENRLREVPLPAPRGMIYDRHGLIIAENIPGYSVSILSPSPDSLRASLERLGAIVTLSDDAIESAVRRMRRDPNRPTVVLSDASFDQVSVLEEHRSEFPSLIIQASPKRYYPDGPVVSAFVGYTGEISESELNSASYDGYKSGQQIGRAGLEKQYEKELRGREGSRFVEVDARGRVVRESGARPDLLPVPARALKTHLDLDLQRYIASYFGDSLQGGVLAMEPTGEVLAVYSAPTFDPNRFIGGIPKDYWAELNADPRRPLYNKAIQGRYPPGSTFKLAMAAMALESGIVTLNDRMPAPCTGGYTFGTRRFKCWDHKGHGSLTLAQAIEKSCDVYFYQLGLRIGLTKLIAGGVDLDFRDRSGIDLPNESAPLWPYAVDYYNRLFGPRGWTNAVVLNLSIGQGENSQTVASMARFFTALATDGEAATPIIGDSPIKRSRLFTLDDEDMQGLRSALAGVVSGRGTAASAVVQGVTIGGKTGTAQNTHGADHAWFVGFAPVESPQIVISVMLEFGEHGSRAARAASKIIAHYLKRPAITPLNTEGE
ncbi:MAG: Peptidoglycan D,D-transpeptidase MrdA [Gemmatimonadaceae bacterium]|nr:Peptidoglycan D,D-transpeptidase MrdA [Gemmatimonadaceae bacterium]